ncbi:MAG: hypothetical protein WCP20_14935 [Desulfuromonadales bacterium]
MPGFNFKRLNHITIIYRVVQIIMTLLLLFMVYYFQRLFAVNGKPVQIVYSFFASIIFQLILFYPTYRLSSRDANIEIESCALDISVETLVALRKKRLLNDLWKCCVVIFYITFVSMAPDAKKSSGAPLVLSTSIFSFLLTCLTYFQGFNFCAKRQLKQMSATV